MTLRYLSVCSGIEAATVAWHPLGFIPAAFSEIEAFPRAVLAHHYPAVPCHGDFTTIGPDEYGTIDLLVGGTPCQSFSIAGLRGGMADGRGNLALEYIRLARRKRARWLAWENVPGVFSSNGGDDFRCFLAGLVGWHVPIPEGGWKNAGVIAAGPGHGSYGVAWRVFDAQFAGIPQRRRRVFVIGYIGDWRRAAAVLFERHSLSGNTPPRRKKRTVVAALTANGVGTCGADDNQGQVGHLIAERTAPTLCAGGNSTGGNRQYGTSAETCESLIVSTGDVAHCLNAGGMGRQDYETETLIAHSLRGEGFDASEDGTGRGTPLVPVAIQAGALRENPESGPDGIGVREDGIAYTLEARAEVQAVCFSAKDHGADASDISPTLRSGSHSGSHANGGVMPAVAMASAVRRLTPRECERLQGFPDDYTLIERRGKAAADGPRYKALGNSMAVPVMRWIGERIALVDSIETNCVPKIGTVHE